jgi:hypothetical protein
MEATMGFRVTPSQFSATKLLQLRAFRLRSDEPNGPIIQSYQKKLAKI